MIQTIEQIEEAIELANVPINDIVYEYYTSRTVGDRDIHTTYNGQDFDKLVKLGTVKKHSLTAKQYVNTLVEDKNYTALSHGHVYLSFPIHRFTEYKKYMFTNDCRCFTTPKALYVTTNYGILVSQGWLKDLKYLSDCTRYHEVGTSLIITTDDMAQALLILNNNDILCSVKLHDQFCELYFSGFLTDIVMWLRRSKTDLTEYIKENLLIYEEYQKQGIKDCITDTSRTNTVN